MTSLQPAENSNHSGESGQFRVEVYEKKSKDLNIRFENIFERVSLLPELLPDRFIIVPLSANARGFELSLEGARDRFDWWANIALSRTQNRLSNGWFKAFSNVFDHANYCCVKYQLEDGSGTPLTEDGELLGRVPNLGLRWQF